MKNIHLIFEIDYAALKYCLKLNCLRIRKGTKYCAKHSNKDRHKVRSGYSRRKKNDN